jgi:putative transposase
MTLELLDEAVAAGARLTKACALVGISVRSVERWRSDEQCDDKRAGPITPPLHKLTEAERQAVLDDSEAMYWPRSASLGTI